MTFDRLQVVFRDLSIDEFRDVRELYDMVVRAADRAVVKYVIERVAGNPVEAAAILGISRSTLRTRLHEMNMGSK